MIVPGAINRLFAGMRAAVTVPIKIIKKGGDLMKMEGKVLDEHRFKVLSMLIMDGQVNLISDDDFVFLRQNGGVFFDRFEEAMKEIGEDASSVCDVIRLQAVTTGNEIPVWATREN